MNTQSVTADQVQARGTVFRLAAAMLDYPLAETQQALREGRMAQVLSQAMAIQGEPAWPALPASSDLQALEVGYMATFVHGRRGRPHVPLVASAYEQLLAGDTPGRYLLNVQAFYRHFGLKAATDDEGHIDEPDHLVTMLEFCALLCHLEQQALESGGDVGSPRRALRDFLTRYLVPMASAVRERFNREADQGLDANLACLVQRLPDWAARQCELLEHQVGPCPQPGQRAATGNSEGMWE
ncbi:molecular chaperone TorD family protein [Oceanimonas sp. CHS3-5]|uniref:molecular chaperone TorD family protein n=1 Tax=Oceanimonas sp. CHS3-5 TaxID=3068186 RepID=UPI00273DABBC|nr:molecular chaperone TorD family protein [Oceanimonas sp. CHS3-5]MDP5291539.1 molecular chaperone TorD family protein [Oceanimonas sp. CHS3-5]